MLNQTQAFATLRKALPPEYPIKAWADYKEVFLFRIEHPDPAEKDFDPFFSVNKETGECRDFSVLTDGNTTEINGLTWTDI